MHYKAHSCGGHKALFAPSTNAKIGILHCNAIWRSKQEPLTKAK
ncbi:hypothetical protein MNB_SV-4-1209 [hydrothermal vent metagenome]|uniref:Uncharacterized protein n=1 Tax=hydrothermal vent metagenome TaxID=652676 RepID=A0A1W1E7Y8_9ZZZZ